MLYDVYTNEIDHTFIAIGCANASASSPLYSGFGNTAEEALENVALSGLQNDGPNPRETLIDWLQREDPDPIPWEDWTEVYEAVNINVLRIEQVLSSHAWNPGEEETEEERWEAARQWDRLGFDDEADVEGWLAVGCFKPETAKALEDANVHYDECTDIEYEGSPIAYAVASDEITAKEAAEIILG